MTDDDLVEFLRARLDDKERQARFRLEDTDSQAGAFELDADDALAEVEANRRIIVIHHGELVEATNADREERSGYWCAECSYEAFPCRTLRLLASVYADHDDYHPEWALS